MEPPANPARFTWKSVATNIYGTGAAYALGSVVSTTTIDSKLVNNGYYYQHGSTTTNQYAWYDGAALASLTYDRTDQNAYVTTYQLNGAGQLISASVGGQRPHSVTFVNDLNGQAIRRDEADTSSVTDGDPHEVWYRFNSRQMGMVGNNGTLETDYETSIENRAKLQRTGPFRFGSTGPLGVVDFDLSVSSINSYSQGGAGGSYTARAGDTLAGIAAQLWGDASLWYKLAEANGLSGASALSDGQVLTIPAGMMKNTHNAATFKPYDPGDVIGETSPTNPKPKKNNRCGVFGAIILSVIAIAVSVVLPIVAPATFGGVIGGMGAAVAGSVVSQGVGLATGLQDKFSWKQVAMAGLTAGVAGGLDKIGAFTKLGIAGSKFGAQAAQGVITEGLTQGLAVATGLQNKFDWAGIAAAGLGQGAGSRIKGTGFGADFARAAADGIASASARSLITGTSFGDNLVAVLPSVIGRTIGNALAGAVVRSRETGLTPKPALPFGEDNVTATGVKPNEIVITSRTFFEQSNVLADAQSVVDLYPGGGLAELLQIPTSRNPRVRMGGNGGPELIEPRTGQVLGVPFLNGPLGPILAPVDSFLGLWSTGYQVQADLLDRQRDVLRRDLRNLDPNWREQASARSIPEGLTARLNDVLYLRTERAFALYRTRGETGALATETLRVYQGFVDQGYDRALAQYQAGRLQIPNGWNLNQVLGSRADAFARDSMRRWFEGHGVREQTRSNVTVNRRLATEMEGSYRIPDVRVGGVVFDATLSPKSVNTPQVRGYFSNPSVNSVIIVRPSRIGPSYMITRSGR